MVWALTTSLSIFKSFSLFSWLGKVLSVITSLIPPLGHLSFVWPTFTPSLNELHQCFVLGSWVRAMTGSNPIDIFPQDQLETTNMKQNT